MVLASMVWLLKPYRLMHLTGLSRSGSVRIPAVYV